MPVWVLDVLAPALEEEGFWALSICHGCSGKGRAALGHIGGWWPAVGALTPHLHSIEGDAGAACCRPGGFAFWPIPVALVVELCQRPMVLQGRVEKRLCSCVLGRWPVLTLSPAQVGMVGDFSVFGVFSAVAEFRGQGPCDCKVVCAYVGGPSVCTM